MLKVVAADSGAAILDWNFNPLCIVVSASVFVVSPYRLASRVLAEPVFFDVSEGFQLIPRELELCEKLLSIVRADVVHLDLSLGAISVFDLSASKILEFRVSGRVRKRILELLPSLRRVALRIKRNYGIDVIAIGKESVPVRIAELTCGACAIIYVAKKVLESKKEVLLGLPTQCQPNIGDYGVWMRSTKPGEQDVYGFAEDDENILANVRIKEVLNPTVRGFRTLLISPLKC